MIPSGSIPIKVDNITSWFLMILHMALVDYWHIESLSLKWKFQDYAIETPLKKFSSSSEGDTFQEVRISLKPSDQISAINFVLKVRVFKLALGDVNSFFFPFKFWHSCWCRMRKLVLGINTKGEISRFLCSTTLTRMLI